jgi:hypothetical protein
MATAAVAGNSSYWNVPGFELLRVSEKRSYRLVTKSDSRGRGGSDDAAGDVAVRMWQVPDSWARFDAPDDMVFFVIRVWSSFRPGSTPWCKHVCVDAKTGATVTEAVALKEGESFGLMLGQLQALGLIWIADE